MLTDFRKEEAMVMKRRVSAGLWVGAIALAVMVVSGTSWADFTTERPGSILILPKVVVDDVRDTTVQITNTSNILVHAHCFYVNGAPLNPDLPPGPTNPPQWQETDFFLWLTRQQPTHWRASTGRRLNPLDGLGQEGSGLDPGLIPPVPNGFAGELVCVQVDASGVPTAGNALVGVATLNGPGEDVSKYNGIAFLGDAPNEDTELLLDNSEYAACPTGLQFPHLAQAAQDPILGGGSIATGRLTLTPCTQNFEEGDPTTVSVNVRSCDELEVCLSGDILFDCWFDRTLDLADPGNAGLFQSDFGFYKYSRLTPNPVCNGGPIDGTPCNPISGLPDCGSGTCDRFVGLLGVYESTHTDSSANSTRSLQNLHSTGEDGGDAVITLVGIP
jgi:hypothetical protein